MVRVGSKKLWRQTVTFLAMVLIGGSGAASALEGSGTQGDPWLIKSLADFDELAGDPNYWDDYTRLQTDVNLAGRVYDRAVIGSFAGVFDGNDHKIIGLTIDDGGAETDYLGLFRSLSYGHIRNLGIQGGWVAGTGNYVGAFTGRLWGTIENCYSTADVNGIRGVGGLVGYLDHEGVVLKCYCTGNVTGQSSVGGIAGFDAQPMKSLPNSEDELAPPTKNLWGGVYHCYTNGSVKGVDRVGGIVGNNSSRLSDCYCAAKVHGTGLNAGAIAGSNGFVSTFGCTIGLIEKSYWDAQATGQDKMCGDDTSCSSGRCNNSYARTTQQMKRQSTFEGWDFINTWAIGEDQTYPYLRTVLPSDLNKDRTTNFIDLAVVAEKWMSEGE